MLISNRISANRKPDARKLRNRGTVFTRIQHIPITAESQKAGSLYRKKNTNSAYLMMHLFMTNNGIKTIVIRKIGVMLGKEKGTMVHKGFTTEATYMGQKSTFRFGTSDNLLPLLLSGNTPKDAYLCFTFPDADIRIGTVTLQIATSKGNKDIPLEIEVVG